MIIKKTTEKRKERKLGQLSISGINEQAKVEFIEFNKAHGLPYHETFGWMWDYFKYFYTPLTREEKELARQAAEIAGKSFEKTKKTAIIRAIKRIVSNKDKVITDVEIDKNNRTSPRAANLRIAEIVEEMMAHNDKEKKWYNRRFISQKAIDDYAKERKKTSSSNLSPNMAVIKRYIENNQALLAEHHLKHKMDDGHNRKAYNYKRNRDYKEEREQENAVKKAVKKEELNTIKKQESGIAKRELRYKKTKGKPAYTKGQNAVKKEEPDTAKKEESDIVKKKLKHGKAKNAGGKRAKEVGGKRAKGDKKGAIKAKR